MGRPHQPSTAALLMATTAPVEPLRIIRPKETSRRTGLSNTQHWRMEQLGTFPKRIRLSDMASGHIEAEVEEWIKERIRLAGRARKTPLAE
jgi:predicted DNA-binding transcriptional regulator AlpA